MNRHSSAAIGVMLILGWLGGSTRTVSAGQGQQSVPVASASAAARAATAVPTLRGFSLTLVQGDSKVGQVAGGYSSCGQSAGRPEGLSSRQVLLAPRHVLDGRYGPHQESATQARRAELRRGNDNQLPVIRHSQCRRHCRHRLPSQGGRSGRSSKQEAAEAAQKAALLRRELDAAVRNLAVKRQQLADGLVPESSVIQAERVADEWKTRVEAPKPRPRLTQSSTRPFAWTWEKPLWWGRRASKATRP